EPCANDVVADRDYGYRPRRLLGDTGREIAAGENCIHFQPHQLGGELGKLLETSLRVAQLERYVLALDQTRCAVPAETTPCGETRAAHRPATAGRLWACGPAARAPRAATQPPRRRGA